MAVGSEKGEMAGIGCLEEEICQDVFFRLFPGEFFNCFVNQSIYESCGRENVTSAIHLRQGLRSY